jgi:hypothetical protein
MNTLLTILGIGTVVCCSQMILGPVLVFFNYKQRAHPTFREFDPQPPSMPLSKRYFGNIEELERLGFTATAHLRKHLQRLNGKRIVRELGLALGDAAKTR